MYSLTGICLTVEGEHVYFADSFSTLGALLAACGTIVPGSQWTPWNSFHLDEFPLPQCLEVSALVQKNKDLAVPGLFSPYFAIWQLNLEYGGPQVWPFDFF